MYYLNIALKNAIFTFGRVAELICFPLQATDDEDQAFSGAWSAG